MEMLGLLGQLGRLASQPKANPLALYRPTAVSKAGMRTVFRAAGHVDGLHACSRKFRCNGLFRTVASPVGLFSAPVSFRRLS
jgi:hypothetical protein